MVEAVARLRPTGRERATPLVGVLILAGLLVLFPATVADDPATQALELARPDPLVAYHALKLYGGVLVGERLHRRDIETAPPAITQRVGKLSFAKCA